MVLDTTQKPTRISAGAYPMNWDSIFRVSSFKAKHVSIPKDDAKGV